MEDQVEASEVSSSEVNEPIVNNQGKDTASSGDKDQHQLAFERAQSRKKANPSSLLSTGENAIKKTRGKIGSLDDLKKLTGKNSKETVVVDQDPGVEDALKTDDKTSKDDKTSVRDDSLIAPAPGEIEIPEVEEDKDQVSEPVYKPSYKYKAYGEEHDVPEIFRELIKDPKSEREVHDVFEKLHGFEKIKENREVLDKAVREQLVPEINFYRQTRAAFNEDLSRGDVFSVLEKMGMPEEKVLQAVVDRINLKQMPPEQRAAYDARVAAEKEARLAASQVQSLSARVQQMEALAKNTSIQSTLARSDVSSVVQNYDTRVGKPGAFEELVRMYGDSMYRQGRDITPLEAVQGVMERFGLGAFRESGQQTQSSVTAPVARQEAQLAPQQRSQTPKIIPNISSRSATPSRSKPQINSVEDLKKLAKQMRG